MKTKKIAIAALLMFALISITPRAEGAIKSKKHIAISESVTESNLKIEAWMTENYLWNPEYLVGIAANEDAKMEIEGWMVNTSLWNYQVAVAEPTLKLENWMTNQMVWSYIALLADKKLEIENWMTSQEVWRSGSISDKMNSRLML